MASGVSGATATRSFEDDQSLTPDQYLQKHQVAYYMNDVIGLLLRARDEHPLDFLADYFAEVLSGTHVLLREYAYVNRSARDRWAFVASAREALADLDQCAPTTAAALTQLLRLVCPDFPLEVVADACRLCGDEHGAHALDRLLHATCVRLCYGDFLLHKTAEAFRACDARLSGRVERAAVGLALRHKAVAMAAEERPPAEIFDELHPPQGAAAAAAAEPPLTLNELQQALVHSAPMYGLFADCSGTGTLVASPPPRGALDASSPGSCAAMMLGRANAAGASQGGGTGGARRRLQSAGSRERLLEAAAGTAGRRGAAAARVGSAKTRRTPGFAAARLIAAASAPGTAASSSSAR